MEFIKKTSPYIKRKDNLKGMLLDVVIALLPTLIFAFIVYPLDALRIVPLSIFTFELCEFLFVLITKKDYKAFNLVNALSALISALIYSLMLPGNLSWDNGMGYFIVIIGAAMGTVFAKLLFGGFGNNIFNPACFGGIVVRLFWGGYTGHPTSSYHASLPTHIFSGGTALGAESYSAINQISLLDMLLGKTSGALGEGFAITIIVGLIYLLVRHTIDWRTYLSYCLTFIVLMLIAGIIVQVKLGYVSMWRFLAYEILGGGFLFGSVFMITDPVTGPVGSPSRVIFGMFGATIAVFIRLFTASPEGVGYSILFANMIAPVLDYPSWSSSKWKRWHYISIASIAVVGILAVTLVLNFKEGAVL